MLVGDDRDLAAMRLRPDRDLAQLADDRRVARVRRMHRHRAVAEHGFGAGGGDGDVVAGLAQGDVAVGVALDVFVGLAAGQGVLEVPHVAGHFAVLDLEVRDRGLQHRVPVDQALAAVDQALLVQAHEGLDDGVGGPRVPGEHAARPVAAGADAAHLPLDGVARLRTPLPALLPESLATQRSPRLVLAHDRPFAAAQHTAYDGVLIDAPP